MTADLRSVGDVVGPAFLSRRYIRLIPLLLSWAVGVLLQRFLTLKLHHDDVFVAFLELHLDRSCPDVLNAWKRDVLCRADCLLNLLGRRICLPLDRDHVNYGLRLVRSG